MIAMMILAATMGVGTDHKLVLIDGVPHFTGGNAKGQGCMGDTVARLVLTPIPGLADIESLSAGEFTSAFVTGPDSPWGQGHLLVCGANGDGRLGLNNLVEQHAPVLVPDPEPGVRIIQAAVGGHNIGVLLENGNVYVAGRGVEGEIGDQHTTLRKVFTKAAVSDIVQLEAGYYFFATLDRFGVVRTWGRNEHQNLGPQCAGMAYNATPTIVTGIPAIDRIAVGDSFVLARAPDGSLWGWGADKHGQLLRGAADNTILDQPTPGQALLAEGVVLYGVEMFAAGGFHTLVVLTDGTFIAGGENLHGEVGDGTKHIRRLPVPVIWTGALVAELAAGDYASSVRDLAAVIWTAGLDTSGQQGDGVKGADRVYFTDVTPGHPKPGAAPKPKKGL